MNTIQKRFLLFLIGCIGSRLAIMLLAKNINKQILKYMGYLALVPAMGFAMIYIFGLRKTGGEVFGEKIWWNDLRPIHSILYFIFAYMAINGMTNAWKILLIDVIIGLISFLWHHYSVGDFNKLQ
jgi:hypothetical protein